MAPGKDGKATKPGGKDIRLFFGNNQSQPSPLGSSQSKGSQKNKLIVISDDDGHSTKSASAQPKPEQRRTSVQKRKQPTAIISSDEDEEEVVLEKKPRLSTTSTSTRKSRPSAAGKAQPSRKKIKRDDDYEDSDDYFEDDGDDASPPKKAAGKAKPSSSKPSKKETPNGKVNGSGNSAKQKANTEVKSEDTVKAGPSKSFDWAAAKAAKMMGPVAPGSKSVPNGAPDCLQGLSLVFTGELSAFSRDEAVELAKRFGGRVVGQPSSKTSYVVLGEGAGPAKLAAIKKHNLRTLSEDEFLDLIATRKPPSMKDLDDKTRKKIQKEEEAIKQAATEMEKREKKAAGASGSKAPATSAQLWTTRYAPQGLKEICGNKGQVEKLLQWLQDWPASAKSNFKKPGKNGMNVFRAVMVTGPPGIGKTTSAHLCAKLAGFIPIELNASDARSKKLVENATNINNTSLDGWMHHSDMTTAAGITVGDRSCLIMDEVDGMSAGDRGGVGALNTLIRKTKIPIICIANERNAQKLKPLLQTTFNLSFRRPQANEIRSRIMSILFKEGMKVSANVIDQLVASAQSDIRQVLNMLSTWKLSSNTMDFDEGTALGKSNEKYTIMTPFDVTNKMLGPYLFSPTSRESLGDKIELYFHDHAFVPLFIQENYLKTQPTKIRNLEGPEKALKYLELMDKAASSLSDGDLVDGLIHGPEQYWSLMPLHAVCSTVRPSSFLYGQGAGYGGPNGMTFPQWLGQNSKQGKLSRQLGDVQTHMRLKVSANRAEIRQSYIPSLFPSLVKPLMDTGASAVDDIIEFMDEYYLTKEDWDTVVELGVGDQKDDAILKKISTATKTSFTKKYNSGDHPIPFHKADALGKVPKRIAGEPAPDLEEAFDLDDDVGAEEEEEKSLENTEEDITKDPLLKAAKPKGKGKSKKAKS